MSMDEQLADATAEGFRKALVGPAPSTGHLKPGDFEVRITTVTEHGVARSSTVVGLSGLSQEYAADTVGSHAQSMAREMLDRIADTGGRTR